MTTSLEKLSEELEKQSSIPDRVRDIEKTIFNIQNCLIEIDRKLHDCTMKIDNMVMQWQNITSGSSSNSLSGLCIYSTNIYKAKNNIPSVLNEPDKNEYDAEYSIDSPQFNFYVYGKHYPNLIMLNTDTIHKMLDDIASLKDIVKREYRRTCHKKIDSRDLILDADNGRDD